MDSSTLAGLLRAKGVRVFEDFYELLLAQGQADAAA